MTAKSLSAGKTLIISDVGDVHAADWNVSRAEQQQLHFLNNKMATSFFFFFFSCRSDPRWKRASCILEVFPWGGRITFGSYAYKCRQRWRSKPVSPTSAFPATTSKGTRKSATPYVQRPPAGHCWISLSEYDYFNKGHFSVQLSVSKCYFCKRNAWNYNNWLYYRVLTWTFFAPFLQVYKVIVNVGQQEWFVFRRYAEFDKLYNTVSGGCICNASPIFCIWVLLSFVACASHWDSE